MVARGAEERLARGVGAVPQVHAAHARRDRALHLQVADLALAHHRREVAHERRIRRGRRPRGGGGEGREDIPVRVILERVLPVNDAGARARRLRGRRRASGRARGARLGGSTATCRAPGRVEPSTGRDAHRQRRRHRRRRGTDPRRRARPGADGQAVRAEECLSRARSAARGGVVVDTFIRQVIMALSSEEELVAEKVAI